MPSIQFSKSVASTAFALNRIQLGAAPAAPRQTNYVSTGSQYRSASSQQYATASLVGRSSAAASAGWAGGGGGSRSSNSNSSASQTATPMACPPALFQAASNSVADVNVQRDQHLYYSGLLDSMIDAVQWAHEQWRKEAYFSGVRITGMFAHGGQLNGPNLWDLIRRAPTVSGCNGQEARVRDAVAGGVANCFIDWQRTVSVPALPWYPPFLGWPGSFAPQMPNIPSPLSLCSSVQGRSLGDSTSLKDAMKQKLQGNFSYHDVFFGALAKSFAPGFTNWVLQQMVTRVFGYGPVPTYLQPFVIVGPVVGGEILAKPGHLMA